MINANINAIGAIQERPGPADFSNPAATGSLVVWFNTADPRSYSGTGSVSMPANKVKWNIATGATSSINNVYASGAITWNPLDKFFDVTPIGSIGPNILVTTSLPTGSFTVISSVWLDNGLSSPQKRTIFKEDLDNFFNLFIGNEELVFDNPYFNFRTDATPPSASEVNHIVTSPFSGSFITNGGVVPNFTDLMTFAYSYNDATNEWAFYYVPSTWFYSEVEQLPSYYTRTQEGIILPQNPFNARLFEADVADGQIPFSGKFQSFLLYDKALSNNEVKSTFQYLKVSSGFYDIGSTNVLLWLDPGNTNSYTSSANTLYNDLGAYKNNFRKPVAFATASFNAASGGYLEVNGNTAFVLPSYIDVDPITGTLNRTLVQFATSSYSLMAIVNKTKIGSSPEFEQTLMSGIPTIATGSIRLDVSGSNPFKFQSILSQGPGSGSIYSVSSPKVYETGSWYMVTSTYHAESGSLDLWVNNELISTTLNVPTFSGNFPISPVNFSLFGQKADNITDHYGLSGSVGPIKIWNTALTPDEIEMEYNEYKDRFGLA
jgi:hypothetical protein